MLHLGPGMPGKVFPAHRDLICLTGLEVNRQLSQTGPHAAGKPDSDLAEDSPEVLYVELAVQSLEPMEQPYVSRTSTLSPLGSRFRCRIGMHRELQELPFRRSPLSPRDSWIQKLHHRLQHVIRRKGISPVYPEDPPAQAQHDCLIRVGENPLDIPETQRLQPLGKTVLEKETLPRCPAAPLPRLHSP